MSTQERPTTEGVDVCDLCGKPVDTYGHRDWSVMNIGHRKVEAQQPERSWFKFLRKGSGDRQSGALRGTIGLGLGTSMVSVSWMR